jgi:hypothetical protein
VRGGRVMDGIKVVEAIKSRFQDTGSPANIPMQTQGSFKAKLTNEGVLVDNLGGPPFLPWIVFQEAICVLIRNDGRAALGDATYARLGSAELSLDSIEGHIAQVVYGKKVGDPVFGRIAPIADILIWAGVCGMAQNELILFNHR